MNNFNSDQILVSQDDSQNNTNTMTSYVNLSDDISRLLYHDNQSILEIKSNHSKQKNNRNLLAAKTQIATMNLENKV